MALLTGSVTNSFSSFAVLSGRAQEVPVGSHQMAEHSDTGSMESYPEELMVETNADCGDYVVEGVDVGECSLQPICLLTEGPAVALRPEQVAVPSQTLQSTEFSEGDLEVESDDTCVDWVIEGLNLGESSHHQPPFCCELRSATSLGEDEAAGAFLTHDGAQATDTDEARGERTPHRAQRLPPKA
ncbi:hypothetical protein AALO_G00172850 [Alosa alosa]|uniref:Uncharacterized protein n=1 Tax=Alosa alosa TaxID=278164 RepID=A0AAV6GBG2_9TELE|nr:hypothetical protein AALO_G00172850 [Alosa alosa]